MTAPVDDGFLDATARREYLRLAAATLLIYFTNAHASLLAVVFAKHGMPLPQIGLLLSMYGVPVVIVTFLTGAVTARIGTLGTARLGMAVMIVGFGSLQWTADAFWPAMASRLVWGVGYGLLFSPLFTYAQSRLTPARFVYLLGVFSSMAPLAQAFGPPWAEWVLAQGGDDVLFLAGTVAGIVALLLTLGMRPLAKSSATSGLALGPAFARERWLPLVAIFVSGSLFGYLASYMAPTLQGKGVAIGWFFISSTCAMFASRFLALKGVESFEPRLVVGGGLLLMGIGFAITAAGASALSAAAGGIVFGTGYSAIYPVLSAWISRGLAPSERSGPQAVFNAVFTVGLNWMPMAVTFVVAAFGYDAALGSLAALGGAMAAVLIVLGIGRRTLRAG